MDRRTTAEPAAPAGSATVVMLGEGGGHRFDLRQLELSDPAGRRVPLRPQAAQVLAELARRAGELVTKDELLDAVWPGVVVTEDSLVQCVRDIRRALGDETHRVVRTESRRGYRLVSSNMPAAPVAPWAPMPEADFRQQIRFARTSDGVRIAYAEAGQGLPVVRTAHWMTHLEWDWRNPVFGPIIRSFAGSFRFYRYDSRGWGLSDREPGAGQLSDWQLDLEAVVDSAGLDRFVLFGPSGGAAIAVRYAALHAERVAALVLLGGFARGSLERDERSTPIAFHNAFARLIEDGWGQDNDAFRQLMTSQLWPNASADEMRAFNHLQRMASSARIAADMYQGICRHNVMADLPLVRCPTLVTHSIRDARVPFEEGRILASNIPGARLEPFDSPNHTPLLGESEFERLHRLIAEFIRESGSGAQQGWGDDRVDG